MSVLLEEVWLFQGFSYICDFFQGLAQFSTRYTVEQILTWLQGEWVGGSLSLTWTNIITGVKKYEYLSPNWFTGIVGAVLDIAFWFLPQSVYHMPLYAGVIVASFSWFFVVTVVKFVKGVIK